MELIDSTTMAIIKVIITIMGTTIEDQIMWLLMFTEEGIMVIMDIIMDIIMETTMVTMEIITKDSSIMEDITEDITEDIMEDIIIDLVFVWLRKLFI